MRHLPSKCGTDNALLVSAFAPAKALIDEQDQLNRRQPAIAQVGAEPDHDVEPGVFTARGSATLTFHQTRRFSLGNNPAASATLTCLI